LKLLKLKPSLMNMKPTLTSAFLAAVMLTSCKKDLEPQPSSETPVTETPVMETPAPATQTVEKQFEVPNQNVPNPSTANPVQTQTAPTAPGMNPPHGQPNHRCDIAVGAPLSSPKGAAPAPTAKPAPVVQSAPQGQATITPVDMASGTTATKPGMNPPHGQEGHLCEIAVGAPLPK
jgi:hypothetical protein